MCKQYKVQGILAVPSTMKGYPLPMKVVYMDDNHGATLSITCKQVDIQLTVPFDTMLKDILENCK